MRLFSLGILACILISSMYGQTLAQDELPFENVQTEFSHERIIFQTINELFGGEDIPYRVANLTLFNDTIYTFDLMYTPTNGSGTVRLDLTSHDMPEEIFRHEVDSRNNSTVFAIVPLHCNYTLMMWLTMMTETIRANLTIWRGFPPRLLNHTEYVTVPQNITVTQQMSILEDPNVWIPILGGEILVAVIIVLRGKNALFQKTTSSINPAG